MKAMPKDDLMLLLQSGEGNMVNIGNMQQLFDEYGDDYVWDYENVWEETKSNAYRKAKVFVLRKEMKATQQTNDIAEAVEYIKNAQEYLRDIGETWCANYLSDVVELLTVEGEEE